jgi:hypothetical protein
VALSHVDVVPLRINRPGDDATKRQQVFLAPLPGKALVKRIDIVVA